MKSPCSPAGVTGCEQGLAFINFIRLLLHTNGVGFE